MPQVLETGFAPSGAAPLGLKTVRILSVREKSFAVQSGPAEYEAVQAASCLLAPRSGDLALAYFDEDRIYITAVLDREPGEALLKLPDQTVVRGGRLDFQVTRLDAETQETALQADSLSLSGRLFRMDFQIVHFLAGLVSSACRSLLTRCRNLTLAAEGLTRLRSRKVRLTAEEELMVRSGGVDIQARESVRIDGRDLRLG
ncbi:MAG: DUF3540 domain-containing protein [Deltaproteobacteria bacterium]|jgi:hypothetical protein|nr:DUF3540 domain-containing protein [Deltaproteobacteria bacterium]